MTGDARFQCWECFAEFEKGGLSDSNYQTDPESNCQTTSDENSSSEKEITIIKQKRGSRKKIPLSDITNNLENSSLHILNDEPNDVR